MAERTKPNLKTPEQYQSEMDDHAKSIYMLPFADRNKKMAEFVAKMNADLIARALRLPDEEQAEIKEFLSSVCLEAGSSFVTTEDHQADVENSGNFGPIHLPQLLDIVENDTNPKKLIGKLKINQVAQSVANELKVNTQWMKIDDRDAINSSLKKTVKDNDHYRYLVNNLDISDDRLTLKEEQAVLLATYLAQSIYLSTQIHRANMAGNTDRINSASRDTFNPYPLTKKAFFNKGMQGVGNTDMDGLFRATFEVWKDTVQYRDYYENSL
jgi:hypothetical protein